MSDMLFECKKCGSCCGGLFVYEHGVVSGLSLTEEEAKLFEPKQVAPYMAIGDEKPRTIFFYQLTLTDCPQINEKNECKIYEKRPLICRAFPVHPKFGRAEIMPRCPQVGRYFSGVGTKCPVYIDDDKIETAVRQIILNALIWKQKCKQERLKLWIFDLATKRWIVDNNPPA